MALTERCQRHEKTLYGNGQAGLVDKVTKMEVTVENMNEHLDKLATSYAALAENQLEVDVTEKLKIESSNKRNNIIQNVSLIVGISATLITLMVKIL